MYHNVYVSQFFAQTDRCCLLVQNPELKLAGTEKKTSPTGAYKGETNCTFTADNHYTPNSPQVEHRSVGRI